MVPVLTPFVSPSTWKVHFVIFTSFCLTHIYDFGKIHDLITHFLIIPLSTPILSFDGLKIAQLYYEIKALLAQKYLESVYIEYSYDEDDEDKHKVFCKNQQGCNNLTSRWIIYKCIPGMEPFCCSKSISFYSLEMQTFC